MTDDIPDWQREVIADALLTGTGAWFQEYPGGPIRHVDIFALADELEKPDDRPN